jgi:selenocysteine-specific elongation factor
VDHGKSALVKALTGTDPDRLAEEKARGMTIELGFALLRLPSGGEASIVDVPGHERFVRTMVAGAAGIDLALLAVAANEGVMPQTREHVAIIDLLGIRNGAVALTKCDLVGEGELQAVQAEMTEALAGTTLKDAPLVACSAKTGEGLDGLRFALAEGLARTPGRVDGGRPRLPIDRVFSMAGFGTVVTGTLTGGSLAVGQEVEVAPSGRRARVRGLQNHGQETEKAAPGQRTAVNLSGVSVGELRRGMVLATPDVVSGTTSVDVRLRTVRELVRPVRHNTDVRFHTGTADVGGKLLLLDMDELGAGASGWTQVRLAEAVAVLPGDKFILRGANGTLGGGTVAAVNAPRRRRFHGPTIAALEVAMRPARFSGMIEALGAASGASHALLDELATYHREHPVRSGMPREELRRKLGLDSRAMQSVLGAMPDEVREAGSTLALVGHAPSLEDSERRVGEQYVETLRASPYAPPVDGRPPVQVLEFLLASRQIVRVGDLIFEAAAYRSMQKAVLGRLRASGSVTLAQVRDMFGTSRRYAQVLLEQMDAERITKREGDARILR